MELTSRKCQKSLLKKEILRYVEYLRVEIRHFDFMTKCI